MGGLVTVFPWKGGGGFLGGGDLFERGAFKIDDIWYMMKEFHITQPEM